MTYLLSQFTTHDTHLCAQTILSDLERVLSAHTLSLVSTHALGIYLDIVAVATGAAQRCMRFGNSLTSAMVSGAPGALRRCYIEIITT